MRNETIRTAINCEEIFRGLKVLDLPGKKKEDEQF